jgi:peptide/nickel transport system permease protein
MTSIADISRRRRDAGVARSSWRRLLRLRRSWSVMAGAMILGLFAIAAVVSTFWTPYPPSAPAVGAFYSPPSAAHLFGTDAVGADIFSRALAATRTDVGITVAVVGLALSAGTVLGAVSGFVGGSLDRLLMRLFQVMNSFPSILLAMLVISAVGGGIIDVIVTVALIPMPEYARLARAEVMSKKNWQFAEAARMIGRQPVGVLFRHILPNSTRPLIAYAGINASWVISTVGALGFLGLGIQPGSAEWGSMIAGGQSGIVNGQWWIAFFPGLCILLLAVAFHLIGDGLSDADLDRRGR